MSESIINMKKAPLRKVWIKTFGCQMNYHDSERILANLATMNFEQTMDKNEANLILFNTCAIRDLANMKFYSQLGETKHLNKDKKEIFVGVCGCVAQSESAELLKKYRYLDFVFGTDTIDQINDIVFRLFEGESRFSVCDWDQQDDYSIQTKITHGTPQAFVNIIKGCNNFCTYCIVPYTRGREKSRTLKEVVEDVQNLVKNHGIQEITLLGQNVNSFGKKNGESLAQLINELDKIGGLKRLRYTTSHPYDMSDELIEAHGASRLLSRHLHLPVQSGSNSVLKRMNRKYTVEHYLGLLEKLRKSRSDIVISSDIIVGFPNETEKEFEDTMRLLEKAKFDFIYSYKFSPRGGTKAAQIEDSLSDDVRSSRLIKLQKYQLELQMPLRKALIGKKIEILIDGSSNMKGLKKWKGRTDCNRIVHFIPDNHDIDYTWKWVMVEITEATALSCQGRLIPPSN